MIRDYSPGSGYVEQTLDKEARALANVRWVMECLVAMQRPHLPYSGFPDHGTYWAVSYESQRRAKMEGAK